jgi:ribosome-binding ATPase YchF (GTP1/OBG family)
VPDPRLDTIAKIAGSKEIVPTKLIFVDIAGLVRGASKGEGLGNQFLATIREVDAIAHVVRCFEDGDVTHVEGGVDPIRDIETIETELMLSDLDSLERRIDPLEKKVRGGDKDSAAALDLMKRAWRSCRRQARAPARAQAGRRTRLPDARPPDRQARPLCLQCRRGIGGDRQRISRSASRNAPRAEGAG